MCKKIIFLLLFFLFIVTNSKAKQLTNKVIVSIDNLIITDLDMAIKIVRASGLKQIQLRQDDKVNGGTFEWDNF